MKNYDYQKKLEEIWNTAVRKYEEGHRNPDEFFNEDEMNFLRHEMGVTAQEVYDFAEDYNAGGEPDFISFAMVHDIRRAFFKECQESKLETEQIDPEGLPPKDDEMKGVRWLPRIIEKAKAKLHGRLHPDIMYGCGGDRKFLRDNDIHPAEFLRVVWAFEGDPEHISNWVLRRKAETGEQEEE